MFLNIRCSKCFILMITWYLCLAVFTVCIWWTVSNILLYSSLLQVYISDVNSNVYVLSARNKIRVIRRRPFRYEVEYRYICLGPMKTNNWIVIFPTIIFSRSCDFMYAIVGWCLEWCIVKCMIRSIIDIYWIIVQAIYFLVVISFRYRRYFITMWSGTSTSTLS